MKTSSLALLAAALSSGTFAFTIPDGQPDGVYSVLTHPNGTEEHTWIGPAVDPLTVDLRHPIISARANRIRKRWATPDCYPDEGTEDLDHRTCDAANAALDDQCGRELAVGFNRDIYSISECVVAYFCNFLAATAYCRAQDRQYTSGLITNQCGLYKPGSTRQQAYNGDAVQLTEDDSYGYESYCTSRGHDFCGRGTDG